jgi:hypothetical protein
MQRGFSNANVSEAQELEQSMARLDALAKVMDSAFVIPGTNIRMGLDGVIGLFPVVGDVVGGVVSSYIVWEARRIGAPTWLLARMSLNVAVETGIGAIPILGDAFDIMFRANLRNMALLRGHLERRGRIATKTIDGTFTRETTFGRSV